MKIALIAASVLLAVPAYAATKHRAEPAPAAPQQRCGTLENAVRALSAGYHEAPVWGGKNSAGNVNIMTQSPDGGTWTMLELHQKDGAVIACMVASGTNAKFAPKDDAAPSSDDDEHIHGSTDGKRKV